MPPVTSYNVPNYNPFSIFPNQFSINPVPVDNSNFNTREVIAFNPAIVKPPETEDQGEPIDRTVYVFPPVTVNAKPKPKTVQPLTEAEALEPTNKIQSDAFRYIPPLSVNSNNSVTVNSTVFNVESRNDTLPINRTATNGTQPAFTNSTLNGFNTASVTTTNQTNVFNTTNDQPKVPTTNKKWVPTELSPTDQLPTDQRPTDQSPSATPNFPTAVNKQLPNNFDLTYDYKNPDGLIVTLEFKKSTTGGQGNVGPGYSDVGNAIDLISSLSSVMMNTEKTIEKELNRELTKMQRDIGKQLTNMENAVGILPTFQTENILGNGIYQTQYGNGFYRSGREYATNFNSNVPLI